MRYEDFVKASAFYKDRDWNLFLSLRRDLYFIDGLSGLVAVLFLFTILGIEASTLDLLVYAATTVGCLNGVWQNRVRVKLMAKLNDSEKPSEP